MGCHRCTQDVLILGLAEFWRSLTPCSFSVHLSNQFPQVSGPGARRQAPQEARRRSPNQLASVSPTINKAAPELCIHRELALQFPMYPVGQGPWGMVGDFTAMIGCGREELGHTDPSAPQEGSEVREFWEKCQSHLEIKNSPGSLNRRSKAW